MRGQHARDGTGGSEAHEVHRSSRENLRTFAFGTLLALAAGLTLVPSHASAQEQEGTLTGRIVALDSGEGLSAVGVALKAESDSGQVARMLTAFDGRFRFNGVEPGRYFVEMAGLGYAVRTSDPFEVEPGSVYDFGTVELTVQAIEMDPIEVESVRSAVSYEADRTSYLVDAMPGAEGGTITDALRNVPDLDVDIDGNIEVRGESPAIWIDGRPAPVSGASLQQFLEQFPSDLIERIEVIDTPGAEYDAEGPGGIVNIVLKEGVDLGISGSVFANAGTRGNTGLGARATMQRGDWIHNLNASLRRTDSEVESYLLRQNLAATPSDFVERDGWNANRSLGGNIGLRTQWRPREEAELAFRLDWGGQDGDRDGLVATTYMDEQESPTHRFDRSDLADSNGRSLNLRADFEWEWEPRRHVFDTELRVGRGSDRRNSIEEILNEEELEGDDAFVPAELSLDRENEDAIEFRLDLNYRRPLGESGSVRSGYSLQMESDDNRRTLTFLDDPSGEADPEITLRGHTRDQTMNSAYVTVQGDLGERVSLQMGLRAEHADWEVELPDSDPIARRYVDIFPSANLSYNHDRARRLRLSYSQRVGRPGVSVLDPTNRSTDPLERSVGNPDLDPRITHRVNLTASWTTSVGTFSVGPYFNRTVNGWERITTVDEEGVSTRSWDNLSSQTSTGGSVNFSFRGIGSWRGSANVSGSRSYRDADNLDSRYSGSSSSWNSRVNLNGNLIGDLSMQTSMRYRASTRSLQGRDGSETSVDLSFRYRFLDRRASASLSLRDPFGLQRSESEIRDLTLFEIRRSSRDSRSAQLSISYALGGGGSRGGGGRGGR